MAPFQEFHTTYSDGYVETYTAVPTTPTPFSIHLESNGYIAPGLSMFVYMDGVYQCNRNRQNLKLPDEAIKKSKTEVNFRVRQKEEMLEDGTFNGRSWRFARVNTSRFLKLAPKVPLLMYYLQRRSRVSRILNVLHMMANTSVLSRWLYLDATHLIQRLHLLILGQRLLSQNLHTKNRRMLCL